MLAIFSLKTDKNLKTMVKPIIKWTLERHVVGGQPQGLPLQDVYLFYGKTHN